MASSALSVFPVVILHRHPPDMRSFFPSPEFASSRSICISSSWECSSILAAVIIPAGHPPIITIRTILSLYPFLMGIQVIRMIYLGIYMKWGCVTAEKNPHKGGQCFWCIYCSECFLGAFGLCLSILSIFLVFLIADLTFFIAAGLECYSAHFALHFFIGIWCKSK